MELFNFKTKLPPGPGRILLSEPFLNDPNFERSIILLCAHDTEGSFGFVLNKPTESGVRDLLDGFEDLTQMVFSGGPVQQDTLHFIHRFPGLKGAQEITKGIFWGGDFDELRSYYLQGRCTEDKVRFFVGYSGWSEGQLESELNENAWIVSDKFDESFIFITDPAEMWRNAMNGLGGRFIHYANYPSDPRLN